MVGVGRTREGRQFIIIVPITERVAQMNAIRSHRCTISGCGKVSFSVSMCSGRFDVFWCV